MNVPATFSRRSVLTTAAVGVAVGAGATLDSTVAAAVTAPPGLVPVVAFGDLTPTGPNAAAITAAGWTPTVPATTTTVAPVTTTTAPPATSGFTVKGSQILLNGNPFRPIGANLLGPHAFWGSATAGTSLVAKQWGWNAVRLVSANPGGAPYLNPLSDQTTNDDLVSIVNEFTAAGIVVIISLFQCNPGHYTSGPLNTTDWAGAQLFWSTWAPQFKANPLVWFDLINEPTAPASTEVASHYAIYDELCSMVRGLAPNIMIVEGGAWGQDLGGWNTNTVTGSCLQVNGPKLAAKYPNVIFSPHVYDQAGISTSATDAQRDTRLGAYLDSLHALNLPAFIGECGGYGNHNGGTIPWDTRDLGTQSLYRVAPARGIGMLAWHGQPGDGTNLTGPGLFTAINSPTAPSNLTWHGQLLWQAARA